MKTLIRMVAAVLAIGFCAPLADAQVPNQGARVSLRVENRELREVVDYLRQQSGANLVILEGAETPISLELSDVSWREALQLAAELAGCVVEQRTAGVLTLTKPPRVNFKFTNASVTEVIDAIAAVSGANIVVAPEVTGSLSLRLSDVPWRDALEVAVKTLGYVIVEEARGILRVVDPVSLQAQMEAKSYQLRFLRPKGNYVPVLNSEFVAGAIKPPSGDLDKDFPIITALRRALSTGGELNYIADKNVLIVRDTAQVHAEISDMLERLDVEPAQVFVDVKFVSTANSDLFDLGIDYGEDGPRVSMSMGQIPIKLPFDLGDGGFDDSIIANDSGSGPFTDPTLNAGSTVVPATIFGSLSFTGVTATLRMLQRDTKSQVVQAPKIIALDGREATIFVGETIRYAEARTEQGQAGGLNLSVQEANGSPVEVGFQLLIVPNIIPGTNTLTMEVIPKETSLSGTGQTGLAPAGFDVFTVGASGAEGSIALPRVRASTIVTSMLLESGQTAVIGGLTTDVETERVSRIPYISRIPVLGELFKHRERNKEKRSLMVFITPTIVRSARDTDVMLQRELERRRKLYEGELGKLVFGEEGPPKPRKEPVSAQVQAGGTVELTTFVEPGVDGQPAPTGDQ